ncbi:hypothetical protein KIPB_008745, partial [Kipferlia bialata]|eukprot:g8745.t1
MVILSRQIYTKKLTPVFRAGCLSRVPAKIVQNTNIPEVIQDILGDGSGSNIGIGDCGVMLLGLSRIQDRRADALVSEAEKALVLTKKKKR